MANLRQFNKGETIKITVTPDTGVSMESPVLYVYPDNLDLNTDPDTKKIIAIENPIESGSDKVFTIDPSKTGGDDMPAGDYTVELKYGSTDITIVKQNHAFTLVESGYNVKNPPSIEQPSDEPSESEVEG